MHFGARQVLFREGDHAEGVFILLGGIVRLSRYLPSGRRMVGAFVFTGGIIGLSFDDVYPFDAEAVGPAIVCRFNRAKLSMLTAELPDLQADIVNHLQHLLADAHRDQLPLLNLHAEARIAAFLRMVARCSHDSLANGVKIELAMTRVDIADYLGLTTETVCRAFARLRRDLIVGGSHPNIVRILDVDLINALADGKM